MRRSDRILRSRDDEGPSAQLSFDLKTIAKRSAAKRVGSTSVKQHDTPRESPTISSVTQAIGFSPSRAPRVGNDKVGTTEAPKRQLKRPRRYQQRRFVTYPEDIFDLAGSSPSRVKQEVTEKPEATPYNESSDDEASSVYDECQDIVEVERTPKKPLELAGVVIETAPINKIEWQEIANDEDDILGERDHGGVGTDDEIAESDQNNEDEPIDLMANLSKPKGSPLFDGEYEPTHTDEDGADDEDQDEVEHEDGSEDALETLELDETMQQDDIPKEESHMEVSDTELYTEYGLRDDSVFWEASKIFDQERNWRDLIVEAQRLIKQAKGLTVRSTKNLFGGISNGIDTYKERIYSQGKRRKNLHSIDAEHDSIAALKRRISQVLIDLYPYNASLPSKIAKLTSTAYEVATDIIPGMVGLLQWCLVAHHSNNKLDADGIDQLVEVLDCLNKLCEAVQAEPPKPPPKLADKIRTTGVLVRFMSYVFKGQQKLDTRQPEDAQPQRGWSRSQGHDTTYSVKSAEPIATLKANRPWSRAESETLFDALQKYQGPERYDLILLDLRDALGHRSAEELREKAMETRAGLLALPDEKRPPYSQWSFLDD
ncbi:hypothetical protein FQN49_001769 [Arthroderma sp. PD_2]|nr:hypothetical protein FQN49_001769 [Arthroderma sp. PD_2]